MVVVFPVGKISDVALSAELCRPSLPRALNGVVEANRKKDGLLWLAFSFFLQGGLDFVLDPFAFDGGFG